MKSMKRFDRFTDFERAGRLTPEPRVIPNTTQSAPTPPPQESTEWNPPPPPTGPETYSVALTEEEIKFIVKAMVHSANVHKCFCEQGSEEYPVKATNAYIGEVNRLRKMLEAAG